MAFFVTYRVGVTLPSLPVSVGSRDRAPDDFATIRLSYQKSGTINSDEKA
jgi:hypothetical protein